MGLHFSHDTLPQRVHFGTGRAAEYLADEIARFGASRVMVIAGRRDADTAAARTARLPVALHYSDIVQHVPAESAERARAAARENTVDLLVGLGGGSAVCLAKAIALDTALPIIAVPTSIGYGASFGGLAALLSMLTSCSSGVSVVNIDNGFGAAYQASMINHMRKRD